MSLRRGLYVLSFFALLLTFPWLGEKPFYTRGEPREALVAYSMISTGDYILPPGYGNALPSKPPFVHWCICLFSKLFGDVTELTSRLPSAVAALFFLLSFYVFLSRRTGTGTGLVAALLLLSTIEWYRAISAARVDMLLAALMCGGLLSVYSWYERNLEGVPLLPIVLFAAATLTKGPVGLVLPAGIFTLFLFARGFRPGQVFRAIILIFLPAAALASVWYATAFTHGGDAFSSKVYYENVARFTRSMEDDPHSHSSVYLLGVLFLGLLPWSLILVPLAADAIRSWRPSVKRGLSWFKNLDPLRQFCILVSLSVFVFYLIPSSKRGVYLLPAYPFICVLLANFVLSLNDRQQKVLRRTVIFLAGLVLLFAALLVVLAELPPGARIFTSSTSLAFAINVLGSLSVSGLGMRLSLLLLPVIIAFLIVVWARAGRPEIGLGALFGLIFAGILALDAGIIPAYARALSPEPFAGEIRDKVGDTKLYSFGNEFYGLSFYLRRQIYQAGNVAPTDGLVFLYEKDLLKLSALLPASETLETIARSSTSIVRPGEHILLVRTDSARR